MTGLCAGTPKLTVRDNRGLDVRMLRYNRGAQGNVATQYLDGWTHNVLGQQIASQDPRFFSSETLNFQYTPALSGQVLKTVSVDAGTAKACADIAGRPFWNLTQGRDADRQSDNNITVQLSYDALGRPLQRNRVTADISTGGPVGGLSDIWSYGDYTGPAGATYDPTDTTDPRNANQRGQLFQHFDTAGLIDTSILGYAVQSNPLRQDRHFLGVPCDSLPNWESGPLKDLYGLNKGWLESDTDPANLYSTRWAYNALAQALTQVDAKSHQQHTAYDCAGRKCAASVTPKGGALTPVCADIRYTAAGAIDTRSDANNIQVAYVYEPQTTQRLVSITASRTSGVELQALTYAYDGVGNVVSLSDNSASAQVTFFRNRAVTPDRGYTYDALYQLISATGRENYVSDTPQGLDWPGGGQSAPLTTSNYRPYTRFYTYDPGGNLTTIRSSNWSGAAPPTRQLVVGSTSNRAVCTANNPGATQGNIDTYFDPAGNSIYLDANRNQPMYWTAFHQLYCVITTYRPPALGTDTADWSDSDRESYAYDGSGQRVRKYASSMAGSIWNSLDIRYLPGLELRSDSSSGENLEVIVLDDGARVLNWVGSTGKPSDVSNLQLRFQYADRQNSCQIETDSTGNVITQEEYYPYGGTAVLASRSNSEVKYKYIRYSGKERDATGLYYYGLRYYQPWIGRWINPDPARTIDGQNLYRMVGSNPVSMEDFEGLASGDQIPAHAASPDAPADADRSGDGSSDDALPETSEAADSDAVDSPRWLRAAEDASSNLVAFYNPRRGEPENPREFFGGVINYYVKTPPDTRRHVLRLANKFALPIDPNKARDIKRGHGLAITHKFLISIDLNKNVESAMEKLSKATNKIGLHIHRTHNIDESNFLIDLRYTTGVVKLGGTHHEHKKKYPHVHIYLKEFWNIDTAMTAHYALHGDSARLSALWNEQLDGADTFSQLPQDDKVAVGEALFHSLLLHESLHGLGFHHPNEVAQHLLRTIPGGVLPSGPSQGNASFEDEGHITDYFFDIHPDSYPTIMVAHLEHYFYAAARELLDKGIKFSMDSISLNPIEEASFTERFRAKPLEASEELPNQNPPRRGIKRKRDLPGNVSP